MILPPLPGGIAGRCRGALFFLLLILVFVGCRDGTPQARSVSREGMAAEGDTAVSDTAWSDTVAVADTGTVLRLSAFRREVAGVTGYASALAYGRRLRQRLAASPPSTDSLGRAFEHLLLEVILPFWEGTKWSFEGHTAVPGEGRIACGYFVSTTLRDAGLNVDRYRLAQQSPLHEARSLALGMPVTVVEGDSLPPMLATLRDTLPDGIHFIGLEAYHVGYLLKKDGQLYLIHSNFMDPERGVMIEPLARSPVVAAYNRFYVTELSSRPAFLRAWLSGRRIRVITGP